jgi:hypothetical protein
MANTNTKKTSRDDMDVKIQMNKTGKWVVQKSGNKNPSKITATQKDAIAYGRDIAKKNGISMIIYNAKGDERRRYYNKTK